MSERLHADETVSRHEKHFEKIFHEVDEMRRKSVTWPAIAAILTIVIGSWVALFTVTLTYQFRFMEKTGDDILTIAREQVRQDQRQLTFDKLQNEVRGQIKELIAGKK